MDRDGYNRTGWIETFTGRCFQPMSPDPERISIVDVAHALSQKCRYTGHSRYFYSVAEHCVLMSEAAERDGHGKKILRSALLHDAQEAYLPDVPRPVKPFLEGWAEIEEAVEHAVAIRFGLLFPMPAVVKEYDTRILLAEAAVLMPSGGRHWDIQVPPLEVDIGCWAPESAFAEFMNRFHNLFPFYEPANERKLPAWDTTSPQFDPYRELGER